MSVQTSVSFLPAVAVAGQLADSEHDVISGKATASSTFVPGTFVCLNEAYTGTGDSDIPIRVIAASTDVTSAYLNCGFVVQQTFEENAVNYTGPCIVPVMRKGRIWVTVEEAVAVGDDVYIRYAAGTGTQIGAVRSSADTSTAALLPNAVFLTKASANGLALVQLR